MMRFYQDLLKKLLIFYIFKLYNIYIITNYLIFYYEMKKKIFYMFKFYNVYVITNN